MKQLTALRSRTALVALAVPAFRVAAGESPLGLQTPETIVARQIDDLHAIVLGICILIAVVVFGVMFYSILKHRKVPGREASQFSGYKPLEIVWTVIPCLIVAGIAYPATRGVIEMKDTSSPDLTIKATGYQWKWRYTYLNENIDFFSTLSTPPTSLSTR